MIGHLQSLWRPSSVPAWWRHQNGNIFRVVRIIHQSTVNSPHKGQWRGALKLSLICAWTNGSSNNRDAGDLRRHRAYYDVTVMVCVRSALDGLRDECCINSEVWVKKATVKRHLTTRKSSLDSWSVGCVGGVHFFMMWWLVIRGDILCYLLYGLTEPCWIHDMGTLSKLLALWSSYVLAIWYISWRSFSVTVMANKKDAV